MVEEKINEVVEIPVGDIFLSGDLVLPEKPKGIVIFSHGSGSSRKSPRNKQVATHLREKGFGTLLFDLLTVTEDEVYNNRFDIELLTERLVEVTKWVKELPDTKKLPVGYFGASTGAASALMAAAVLGTKIKAVVSRGGRPDLAMRNLQEVKSAVRLIVGALDQPVIGMNEVSFNALASAKDKDLVIIPGATHLFEEPGKLEEVAEVAASWMEKYLK